MSKGCDPNAEQVCRSNMSDDMEGSELLALFVLDDIPNEVTQSQLTMWKVQD